MKDDLRRHGRSGQHESVLNYDYLVYGDSLVAVASAVSATREGLRVALVCESKWLAGMEASLAAIETHYTGFRCPFLEEVKQRIVSSYGDKYGYESEEYRQCISLEPNNPMITFEPHVMLEVVDRIVEAETLLDIHRQLRPVGTTKVGRRLIEVVFEHIGSDGERRFRAEAFADCSYEGDLIGVTQLAFRLGRESRGEFGEEHAGKLFSQFVPGKFPQAAVEGRLNLLPTWTTRGLLPGSTGEGDDNVQDYSYRICLCCRSDNRHIPGPPPGYDRSYYLGIAEAPEEAARKPYALQHRYLNWNIEDLARDDHIFHGHALPNGKRSWNATNLPGGAKGYALASAEGRREIEAKHWHHALGILYFFQNDEAVPPNVRDEALRWGLAKDEFADNDYVPYKIYIRESRRLLGRYMFKEQDMLMSSSHGRAPIHERSCAVAEFPLDSLPCSTERSGLSLCDGQFFLKEHTVPGQIPFDVMLPQVLDNVLVPVAASVSHVAWGTVRQTPTLVQLGEAAAQCVAMAKRLGVAPADLPIDALQSRLLERRLMITFFNEFDMASKEPWATAVQYFGTKGFFPSYDALPSETLSRETGSTWIEGVNALLNGTLEADRLAEQFSLIVAAGPGKSLSREEFFAMVRSEGSTSLSRWLIAEDQVSEEGNAKITRGEACLQLFRLLKREGLLDFRFPKKSSPQNTDNWSIEIPL